MDSFDRLLDGDATDFERALLDSAVDDSPSARARRRTLVAMGVGAAVVAGASNAAHAATRIAVAGSTAGAAKGVGAVSAVLLLKWVGTGAIVGSIVAAGIATVTTPGLVFSKRVAPVVAAEPGVVPGAPVAPLAPQAHAAVVPPTAAEAPSQPGPVAEPAFEAMKAVTPAAVRADRGAVSPPAAPVAAVVPPEPAAAEPAPQQVAGGSAVVAEVDALDRARAALAAGDARAALSRLAKHDADFPAGVLQPEAVVLRVRALVALGEPAQAVAVANRFITAHPDSAQAGRLRAIVAPR